MRRVAFYVVSLGFSFLLAGSFVLAEEAKPATQKLAAASRTKGIILFDQQIKPALVKHCYECHSQDAKQIEGGLELDSPGKGSGSVRWYKERLVDRNAIGYDPRESMV